MNQQTDKTTALYYRVANSRTDGVYLDNQMQKLLCYAKEQGFGSFALYADIGKSGITLDRPALNALKSDIRAGRVGEIVVKDVSRIARSFIPFMEFAEWIKSCGVEMVSLNDGGRVEPFSERVAAFARSLTEGGERA
jgi:DNA invertase Pin-like site-specific DNA recombinase